MSNEDSGKSSPAERAQLGTMTQKDGVTSIQLGDPLAIGGDPRQAARDMVRGGVHDGATLRVNESGEVERVGGVTRVRMSSPDFASTGDVMSTGTDHAGRAVQTIDGNTYFDFGPGIGRIQAKSAINAGLMRRTAGGGYEPVVVATQRPSLAIKP